MREILRAVACGRVRAGPGRVGVMVGVAQSDLYHEIRHDLCSIIKHPALLSELRTDGGPRYLPSNAKIAHLGDAAFRYGLVQSSHARAPVPRQRQTRREAGAQSPGASPQERGGRAAGSTAN